MSQVADGDGHRRRRRGACTASKSFDGARVLTDVDLEVRRGEIHALAGGNGAGKSTLMKILQGVYTKDAGAIEVGGQPVELSSTHDARAAGIGMVFQEFSLVPTLTVAQNIFLGVEPLGAGRLIRDREAAARARRSSRRWRSTSTRPPPSAGSGPAYWQLTEIAKALAQDARVLIMDEPTASLAKHEADNLFDARRPAQGTRHLDHLHLAPDGRGLPDRRPHHHPARRPPPAHRGLSDLTPGAGRRGHRRPARSRERWSTRQRAPAGRSGHAGARAPRRQRPGPRVQDVSSPSPPGEILGLAGLMGSGRTELARGLFGIDPITAGEVLVRGRTVRLANPRDAIAAGIAMIPEDRRAQGLVLDHSVRDNLLLPLLGRFRAVRSSTTAPPAGRQPASSSGSASRSPTTQGRAPALRRQPAEGRHRQVAGHRPGRPDHGRAHRRGRHRHQDRDPRHDPRPRRRGHGRPRHLLRVPRAPRRQRPRRRAARGPVHRVLERGDIPDEESLQLSVQGA